MSLADLQYLDLLRHTLENGKKRTDRTGTGTIGQFGTKLSFRISEKFPLLTSKKVHWPSVVHELLWFLKGDTNIKYLNDNGVKIWDAWADDNGDLGPVYGAQWRSWFVDDAHGGVKIDQIAELVSNLRNDPFSRRHIVSAWNPAVLPNPTKSPRLNAAEGMQALPPCHTMFQFYVEELTFAERLRISSQYGMDWGNHTRVVRDEYEMGLMDKAGVPRLGLSCQLYQRSADLFLGVPFNIASYSLLNYLVAKTVDMHPMDFDWCGGDTHIYLNHVDQVNEQLTRIKDGGDFPEAPTVRIKVKRDRLEDYIFDDIELLNYNPLPGIKAPISV